MDRDAESVWRLLEDGNEVPVVTLDDFFVLAAEGGRPQGAFWFSPRMGDGIDFEFYRRVLMGQAPADTIVEHTVQTGRRISDIMGTSLVTATVVTKRVVLLLQERELTGWRPYRTRLFDKKGQALEGEFFSLGVIGRAGPPDMARIVKEWDVKADGTKVPKRFGGGLFFHLERWDGSDFSLIDESKATVVTQRVLAALEEAGVGNWTARRVTKE